MKSRQACIVKGCDGIGRRLNPPGTGDSRTVVCDKCGKTWLHPYEEVSPA